MEHLYIFDSILSFSKPFDFRRSTTKFATALGLNQKPNVPKVIEVEPTKIKIKRMNDYYRVNEITGHAIQLSKSLGKLGFYS